MNDETIYKAIEIVSPEKFRQALAYEKKVVGTGFTMGVYPVADMGDGERGYLLFSSEKNLEAALGRPVFS